MDGALSSHAAATTHTRCVSARSSNNAYALRLRSARALRLRSARDHSPSTPPLPLSHNGGKPFVRFYVQCNLSIFSYSLALGTQHQQRIRAASARILHWLRKTGTSPERFLHPRVNLCALLSHLEDARGSVHGKSVSLLFSRSDL